ncbi:MAG: glycosyltransferase family 1 protein [Burkholderiaceae bacterium]|nr:glycosyltransferase family 1 protein [Burkholderiaceae bacterium]
MHKLSEIKRLLIVTDAAAPQVNGVVRTIGNTTRQLEAMGIEVQMLTPERFKTVACPSYPEIRLSLTTSRTVERIIEEINPDALHVSTEGPLGWHVRRIALRRGWKFTTAYHTRFPEYVHARTGIPAAWIYKVFKRFHGAASAVLAPTPTIRDNLILNGFERIVQWTHGVDHDIFYPRIEQNPVNKQNPVFLYVGRLAIEKNVEAFLKLDLPGTKWVAGVGPAEQDLRRKYPGAKYIGVLSQDDLARLYSEADVFVFPSLTDTFGLVMVEAMACGLPVAAFPVPGPLDVIGNSGAGVMDTDLRAACLRALEIPRERAIAHAKTFSWEIASRKKLNALVWMRGNEPFAKHATAVARTATL